jgi:hypothetical protein
MAMALAILKFQEQDDARLQFQADLGVNRFYAYCIGSGKRNSSNGLPALEQIKFTSDLMGPLPDSSRGQTTIEIPNQRFDLKNRHIQLLSFRTADKIGPAISDIVEVSISRQPHATALTFSPDSAMNSQIVETVPFTYQEIKPISSAMFLGSLMKVAKSVAKPLLKTVAKAAKKVAAPIASTVADTFIPGSGLVIEGVLGSLLGGGSTSGKGAARASLQTLLADPTQLQALLTNPQVTQKLGLTPQTAQLLGTVLQQLAATSAAPAASGAMALSVENAAAASYHASPRYADLAGHAAVATLDRPTPANTVAALSNYVEEMSVPAASIAGVPGLMPLLAKSYTPETLKMLMQSMPPSQALGTITHGLIDIGNSFPGDTETATAQSLVQELSFEGRNDHLAKGLSVGLSTDSPAMKYQRVESVSLQFTDNATLMLHGRSRLIYRQDRAIAFPMSVKTPRPITKGIVQLLVKHPQTLEVLIEAKYRLKNITTGTLDITPELSPEQLRGLQPNQDYLVCVSLVWQAISSKTKRKKRLGTSLSQLITLAAEYSFDHVSGTAEVVPLNDVDRFRPYWHQVWQTSLDEMVRRITLDCKYYLALEPERTTHARMETITQLEEHTPTHLEGKLKTGFQMSPYRLNELLPQISSYPLLSDAELKALMTPDFKAQCSYAAQSQVKFKGRRGDRIGLWVYPEMKIQRLVLKQIGRTNSNGQVLELTDHEIYFPMPATVHFIGVGN